MKKILKVSSILIVCLIIAVSSICCSSVATFAIGIDDIFSSVDTLLYLDVNSLNAYLAENGFEGYLPLFSANYLDEDGETVHPLEISLLSLSFVGVEDCDGYILCMDENIIYSSTTADIMGMSVVQGWNFDLIDFVTGQLYLSFPNGSVVTNLIENVIVETPLSYDVLPDIGLSGGPVVTTDTTITDMFGGFITFYSSFVDFVPTLWSAVYSDGFTAVGYSLIAILAVFLAYFVFSLFIKLFFGR